MARCARWWRWRSQCRCPSVHNVAAFGLALIGLGLIERDGLAILLGVVAAVAGVALLALVVFGITRGVGYLIGL